MKFGTSWQESKNRFIIAIALVAIFTLLPLIIKSPYILHLLIMMLVTVILGMAFSMLISTGLVSLGITSFYALGAYACASMVMKLGLSFWFALPLGTLITAVIALGIGSILCRNAGVAFVVLSLMLNSVIIQLFGQIDALGGWRGIYDIPRPDPLPLPFHAPINFVGKVPNYYLVLFLLGIVVLVFYGLYRSRIGRVWMQIRQSPHLAQAIGINIYRYRLLAFVVASSATAMVGGFFAHYFQSIEPEQFGGWASILVQLYPILGGVNFYVGGPIVGAAFMAFVPEFMRIADEIEPIITGVLIVLVILFLPGGILGSLQNFPGWNTRRFNRIGRIIRNWLPARNSLNR